MVYQLLLGLQACFLAVSFDTNPYTQRKKPVSYNTMLFSSIVLSRTQFQTTTEPKQNELNLDKTAAKTLEGGVEPPTLWLTAIRSNRLSYSSLAVQ